MGVIKSILGGIVVLLLTVNLLAVNVVTVADSTVLDGEYVQTTLEEEEAYAAMQSVAIEEATQRYDRVSDSIPVEIDPGSIVRDTLTRSYLQSQVEANIERIYSYLHGEREEFSASVNLAPIKENIAQAIEERIRERNVSELIDIISTSRNLTVHVKGVTLDLAIVGEMARSKADYREARQEFRADIKQAVIDRLVEQAYENRPDEELLALIGIDARNKNASEKASLVKENEDLIKTKLENRIKRTAGDRIEKAVNEQLASLSDRIENLARNVVEGSLRARYQPVVEPATDMVVVGAHGLLTDMTYATFNERLSDAKAALASNVSTVVLNELDRQIGDTLTFSELLRRSDSNPERIRERIEKAQRAVELIDTLTLALPAAALVVIGLLFLITRSLAGTAFGTGFALSVVGGGSYAVAKLAPEVIRSEVPTEDIPPKVQDVAFGVLDQILATLAGQSRTMLIAGVVLLVVGIALRFRGGDENEEMADLDPNAMDGNPSTPTSGDLDTMDDGNGGGDDGE